MSHNRIKPISAVRVAMSTRDGHSHIVIYTDETLEDARDHLAERAKARDIEMKVVADLYADMFNTKYGKKKKC